MSTRDSSTNSIANKESWVNTGRVIIFGVVTLLCSGAVWFCSWTTVSVVSLSADKVDNDAFSARMTTIDEHIDKLKQTSVDVAEVRHLLTVESPYVQDRGKILQIFETHNDQLRKFDASLSEVLKAIQDLTSVVNDLKVELAQMRGDC